MSAREAAPRPSWQRWLLVGWLLLGAVLVARAVARPSDKGVILAHLEFGRRLWHGEPVYAPSPLAQDRPGQPLHPPYPPSFGLLTMPFAGLAALGGEPWARGAWALLQLASAVGVAACLWRWLAPHRRHWSLLQWHGFWLLLSLLSGRFLLRDLHGGGGNLVNLCLCLCAFAAAEANQPRRAGLWLGCSLLTKPTQLWLLPVFWLFGHRRAAQWTLAVGAAGVVLSLAFLRFDPESWLRWLRGSLAIATQADPFATPELGFPPFTWMNQSLRCAVARWFGTVPDEFAALVVLWPPAGLGWPLAVTAALARLASLLLAAAVGWSAWQARKSSAARPQVLAAALVASLLLSPLSWKAHHTALLPVLAGMLAAALTGAGPARSLLGLWFLVCALPGRDLVGDRFDELANSLYLVTVGDLVLLAVALAAARRCARASAP